ncbi:hypothetical protein ACIQZN_01750 [Streptomyces sp. NPDC097595]|uniref:hypothetical protein n=1 Tax=Streptomyces sp. NPDC097595 TaxID=3366090 RepID=UPI00382C855B
MSGPHWAHSDITTLSDGRLVTFSPDNRVMLVLGPDGELLASPTADVVSAHGVTAGTGEDGQDVVWVADPATGTAPDGRGGYEPVREGRHGRAVALRLDGTVERELPLPPQPVYDRHRFEPTAVLPVAATGEVWVSDGYGQRLIHRYGAGGDYLGPVEASRDGAFRCPHAMALDDSEGEVRIIVADRENNRLVALDPDGALIGTVAERLRKPSSVALHEGSLLVGELEASFAHLDRAGRLIQRVGLDEVAPLRPEWPNTVDARGATVAPAPPPGRFNSPHGITVDGRGRVHVVEWLLGGRHMLLTRGAGGYALAPADWTE